MQDKGTRPFESAQKTSQLNEGMVTPDEMILNRMIDEYIVDEERRGRKIITPNAEDSNFVLAKYCDEHERFSEKFSAEEKRRLHLAIQTLFEIKAQRK